MIFFNSWELWVKTMGQYSQQFENQTSYFPEDFALTRRFGAAAGGSSSAGVSGGGVGTDLAFGVDRAFPLG